MDVPAALERRSVRRRLVVAALVVALFVPAAQAALDPQIVELGPGTVERPANDTTYVSIQGFHFDGRGNAKKPARLVAADERAQLEWRFDGDRVDASWFYDVDPMPDGNLLVTSTNPNGTIVIELDPATREILDTHRMPFHDTHDVDRLSPSKLVVANMRNYEDGVSDDRLLVGNTTTGEITWQWRFRDHYPNDTAGGFQSDWTHVNDVDVIDESGRYLLASPRNFDQSIVVDRRTGDVVMRLGSDDDHDVLHEQHNPDYMEREDGTPVILVADSENDRVVEYVRDCGDADPRLGAGTPPSECTWDRVWTVDGFNWPRDADRLPNGNTLITDTLNHRVVEVTPEGEVVWEFTAAWAPYDAERGAPGSNGPTMADEGAGGTVSVHGGSDDSPAAKYTVDDAIADLGAGTPLEGTAQTVATRWAHLEPWISPVWMGSWAALSTLLAALLVAGWLVAELVVRRDRVSGTVRRYADRW